MLGGGRLWSVGVAAFVFAVAAGDLAVDLAAAALVVASTEVDAWVEVGGSG